MKIFKIFIFIVFLFLISSCKETPTDPPEKEGIVPQTNISWASLADTPWPMNHHDPQSTGRSQYIGPANGAVQSSILLYGIEGTLVLDENNNIYITHNNYPPQSVHSYSLEGKEIWVNKYMGSNASNTPLIGKDSTVYVCMGNSLYAYNYDSSVKWIYLNNEKFYNIGMNIDLTGNIYIVDVSNKLNVIDKNGNLVWSLVDTRFRNDANGAPTFSPDSKYLYIQGLTVSVLAVNTSTHEVEWTFGDTGLESSPVIDNNGNLYFTPKIGVGCTTKTLYSLNISGEINWKYQYNRTFQFDNTEVTIDYNGNIYFGDNTLYSVTNNGRLRWKKKLEYSIVSPLICDKQNDIYIGTSDPNNPGKNYIMAFNSDGKLKWKLGISSERSLGASAAITNNTQLVFPTFRAQNILIIN